MTEMKSIAWLALINALGLSGQVVQSVDICELFKVPSRWNGEMVSVRAVIEPGFGEGGPWLSGELCNAHVQVKGVTFANVIALRDPRSNSHRLHSVDFQWDEGSKEQLNAVLSPLDWDRQQLRVTVVGLYETWERIGDLIQEGRPYLYNGFGEQNSAPAQILVRNIKDTVVETKNNPGNRGNRDVLRRQQSLWLSIRHALMGPSGREYFETSMDRTLVPDGAYGLRALRGTVIRAESKGTSGLIIVGMLTPSNPDATLRVTGDISKVLNGAIQRGTGIEFEGLAVGFRQDPFMVTFEVEADKLVVVQ